MTERTTDEHGSGATTVEPDQLDFRAYYWSLAGTVAIVLAAVATAIGITALGGADRARVFPVPLRDAQPEPHLQLDPEGELYRLREITADRLESYGHVDRNAGIVHVPIAEAVRELRARGLPTRTATQIPEPP